MIAGVESMRERMWEYPSGRLHNPRGEFGKASVCIGAITKGRFPIKNGYVVMTETERKDGFP
jgi:hypothetical protein